MKAIAKRTGAKFDYKVAETQYFKYLNGAVEEKDKVRCEKNELQIESDVDRTFPLQKCFKKGALGTMQLRNLLVAAAKHDSKIGYAQGMNFVMAVFLFHSSEVVAFWLFDVLMHEYDVGRVYHSGLLGLHLHSQIIDLLIQTKYMPVWEKMVPGLITPRNSRRTS